MKNNILITIQNNIYRSQKAYDIYKKNTSYYNAKLIYNANKNIYSHLLELLEMKISNVELAEVVNYLFHLERWFLQFEELEKKTERIEDNFIFDPFPDHIPFPVNFFKTFDL